jgi:hypothetical protein
MTTYYDIFQSGKWKDQTTDIKKAIFYCFVKGCEIKTFSI